MVNHPKKTDATLAEVYRQALIDIINPLAYLERKAKEDGSSLNSFAWKISQDRQLAVDIATKALGNA